MKIDLNNILKTSPQILSDVYKNYEYTIKDNFIINQCLHKQLLNNQITFLGYPSEEMLYGGMAGGGKTEALLLGALQYVDEKFIPEGHNKLVYDTLILRRTLDDLEMPNAILDRAKQWLLPLEDTGLVTYKGLKKQFIFSSGATITFRYLAHDNDLMKYQGAEFQYIGFDELTQFKENQYNYLHSRLRKTDDNPIPLRMRSASNPGGIGHEWVKRKFIKGPLPFVPSSYLENIYLEQEAYGRQLDKLDHLTRQQLKYGNWDAVISDGLLVNRNELEKQLIKPEEYENWIPSFCSIGVDPASTGDDNFSIACVVYFTNGNYVLVDLLSIPSQYPEHQVKQFINDNLKYNPYSINFEKEPGSMTEYGLRHWSDALQDLLINEGIILTKTPASSTGSKFARAKPHASLVRQGQLFFNNDLLEKNTSEENPLRNLFNQYVYVHPDKSVMKNYSSPDELDAVSYAFVKLRDYVGGQITVY